jgi:P4 family phage/plasmid primase-like protien
MVTEDMGKEKSNSAINIADSAAGYTEEGWSTIPVPYGEKRATLPGWPELSITLEDIPEYFNNGNKNVGLLNGKPSGGRVPVDLDRPEAIGPADWLLPKTRTGGRESQPRSHRFYRVVGHLPETTRYTLPGKESGRRMLELLSTGTQIVVAPSVHPSGERYIQDDHPVTEIDGEELAERVEDVALAAALVHYYPGQGCRQDYVLAATGYLGRRRLPTVRVERIIEAAVYNVGDEEPIKRVGGVRDTLEKLARGEDVTGGPTLEELAPGLLEVLKKWGVKAKPLFKGPHQPLPSAPHEEPGTNGQGQGLGGGGEHFMCTDLVKEIVKVGPAKYLADAILEDNHFAQDAGGKLYHYAGGTYRNYGERFIKQRTQALLETWGVTTLWSSHRANEVVEYIRVKAPELWARPPVDEINVQNGILNVFTRELRDHSPDFLSTVQLPVTYNPEAECPEWEKFVAATFPEDAQRLAFEIPADLMAPERSSQKAVLFIGEGANGKSTYLEAVEKFVGSTNISGLSLHKMESDRFSVSRLVSKLANICPDLPSTHLTETSMFKAITGGDRVNAEYKYRESFEFAPFARLVFSANQVPRCEDASHAFFRRWLVVPFDKTFDESEQIPREVLDTALSAPDELSGVLNKALEVLPGLRQNGFTESESMREAWTEFRAMTDPVSVWLDKATVQAAEAFVTKADLAKAYNDHCDKQGRAGMTANAFGRAIKRVRPQLQEAQRTVAGKEKVKVWLGIGLKGPDPDPSGPPDQGPGAPYVAGAGTSDSPNSPDSPDSTNCFLNSDFGVEGVEIRGGDPEITNKGNRVNRVNRVNDLRGEAHPHAPRIRRGFKKEAPGTAGLTEEQTHEVKRLVEMGMAPKFARAEVLGEAPGGPEANFEVF